MVQKSGYTTQEVSNTLSLMNYPCVGKGYKGGKNVPIMPRLHVAGDQVTAGSFFLHSSMFQLHVLDSLALASLQVPSGLAVNIMCVHSYVQKYTHT